MTAFVPLYTEGRERLKRAGLGGMPPEQLRSYQLKTKS